MASHPIYQFYAELDDFKPKIWRRFQVMNDITVARLGYILQVLFEMEANHLMAIEVPRDANFRAYMRKRHPDMEKDKIVSIYGDAKDDAVWRYEMLDMEDDLYAELSPNIHVADATQTRLGHAVTEEGEKLSFSYDFGDGWHVSMRLEKVFEDKTLPGSELPRVMEGAGFGIVEDVGGVWGLETLEKAFKKKKGEDYEQFSEWLGVTDFDITAFDIEDMNFRLKKLPRIYKQIYEDRLAPTQRSIDLIERRYLEK